MAAETLGAIALLDPAIKLGRKVYKTYKLQASFGHDFRHYSQDFLAEGVQLDEILRTPIDLLTDSETKAELSNLSRLGSPDDLRELLRQRPNEHTRAQNVLDSLATLSSLFEDCTALIEKYLPPDHLPLQREGGPSMEASDSFARAPSSAMLTPAFGTETAATSRSSLHSAGVTPLESDAREGIVRRTLRKLHMRSSSRSPDRSHKHIHGPSRLESSDVLNRRDAQEAQAAAMHNAVGFRRRLVNWTLNDRSRFIRNIHEIQHQNSLLERLIIITDVRQRYEQNHSPVSIRNAGPKLGGGSAPQIAVLRDVFHKSTKPDNTIFVLGLKEDYKMYAENSQKDWPYLQLASDAHLFPVMALKPGLENPIQSLASSDMLFVIAPAQNQEHEGEELGLAWTFTSNRPGETLQDSDHYSAHTLLWTDRHNCRILQHYPASAGLERTNFLETLDDTRLREDRELFGFRYYLAYHVAAFFSEAYAARVDLSSHELLFLLDKPRTQFEPEDLVLQLKILYLQSLDHESRTVSYGSLQGPTPNPEDPVRKLGILLHEIGSWTPVTGPNGEKVSLNRATEIAKRNAAKSRVLGLAYFNAVQECLDWSMHFHPNIFLDKVLRPLHDLKSKYRQPTDEVY
ncbi:hypothetical protein MMC28_009095 [Mycoblastus sanguinarius]|nr:hypothetical protein [Mycoblastus sanguinarius]